MAAETGSKAGTGTGTGTWTRDEVLERRQLDAGTWVDVGRDWLADADRVYREVRDGTAWHESRLWKYDHYVTEPHVGGRVRLVDHPELLAAHRALRRRYGVTLQGPSVIFYRNGADALGAHRDREMRYTTDTLTAILTLGARRPWVLQPVSRPAGTRMLRDGRLPPGSVDLAPGGGDLFVLGGRAQRDWLHGVPPVRSLPDGRISLQWRWTSGDGPPEQGPSYRAPVRYGRGR